MSEENCEIPSRKLTDWNEIGRLKAQAARLASHLIGRLSRGEVLHWVELKNISNGNITLWKLLLKDLRTKGFNIGNNKDQNVRLTKG